MRTRLRMIVLATAIMLSATAMSANSQVLPDTTLYAVTTTGEIISFQSSNPSRLAKTPKIKGLQAGEKLVGIDFRPSNRMLYGATDKSRIYSIDTATGTATAVGTLTTPLTGVAGYGFDFNPVPDRIRITNDAEQNLRANPADGANVVDKPLVFAATDANTGKDPNVAASAYTNNVAGAKVTMLYNIDHTLDVLLTQVPPNDGVLNTVGSLGVKTTANAGFDIISRKDQNVGIVALQLEGQRASTLYTIDLKTGAVTLVGKIGGNKVVIGITAAL